MEYNEKILASSNQYYFIVFGYIAFEKQIQQRFSKCESYLRERDQRREKVQGERLVCSLL